jgi:hypothetical protein
MSRRPCAAAAAPLDPAQLDTVLEALDLPADYLTFRAALPDYSDCPAADGQRRAPG